MALAKIKDFLLKLKVSFLDLNTIPNGLSVGDYVVLMDGTLARINLKCPNHYLAKNVTDGRNHKFNFRGRDINSILDDTDILRMAKDADIIANHRFL